MKITQIFYVEKSHTSHMTAGLTAGSSTSSECSFSIHPSFSVEGAVVQVGYLNTYNNWALMEKHSSVFLCSPSIF